MKDPASYADKLRRMEGDTLLPQLQPEARDFVRRLATSYRMTFQELRQVAQAARDLAMWREVGLERWWEQAEERLGGSGRERKKALLQSLERHLLDLSRSDKVYPLDGLAARGTRFRPTLVRGIRDPVTGAMAVRKPDLLTPVEATDEEWDAIIDAMEGVMTDPKGTAREVGKDASERLHESVSVRTAAQPKPRGWMAWGKTV